MIRTQQEAAKKINNLEKYFHSCSQVLFQCEKSCTGIRVAKVCVQLNSMLELSLNFNRYRMRTDSRYMSTSRSTSPIS